MEATVNALGHRIPALDPTIRLKNLWLRDLEFPRDKVVISHLSPEDFRSWIYGLDPQQALIMASYSLEIQQIQNRKRNPIIRFFDFIYRWRKSWV